MAKRRIKVGIIFSYNPNWTGGTYYILNLVKSLRALPDADMPEVVVFYGQKSDLSYIREIDYPYLTPRPLFYPLVLRGINKIGQKVLRRGIINYPYSAEAADVVYPYFDVPMLRNIPKKVYWIPDLQEKYYPEFFTADLLAQRDQHYKKLIAANAHIVFSSEAARNDFKKFYPHPSPDHLHVVRFSSIVPDAEAPAAEVEAVLSGYGIEKNYIICPNVLAVNKNHYTVLKAVRLLKSRGIKLQVIFTGKEQEDKFPGYPQEVKEFARQHGLDTHVKFLGFISRREQLILVKNAGLLLQPSLFEGWSSSIEEAKALNKFVIASDLDVHMEQLPQNALFFKRADPEALADVLEACTVKGVKAAPSDYSRQISSTAYTFLNSLKSIIAAN